MEYERDMRELCERIDSINIAKLKEYEKLTGIAATSVEEMEAAYQNRKRGDLDTAEALKVCVSEKASQVRRKKAWKTVCFIGIPVSFGAGVLLTAKFLLN